MPKSILNKVFDCIYCINLGAEELKRRRIIKLLNSENIEFNFISAENGASKGIIEEYNKLYNLKYKSSIKKGAPVIKNSFVLAAVKTKLNILKDARENKYNKILILEDDLIFHKNFEIEVRKVSKAPIDWKIFYLGGCQRNWKGTNVNKKPYVYAKDVCGAFAVGIDRSAYKFLIKEASKLNTPFDHILMKYCNKNINYCFMMHPNLVIADVRESNLRHSKSMAEHAEKVRWNLELYSI